MKTPKQKPARTRAARSSSRRTDKTAPGQAQPSPAPVAAAPPPPPAPTAPAKRKLPGWVHEVDANGDLRGSLVHFRACYSPHLDAVSVVFELEGSHAVGHHLDHVHARATVATLRRSLEECERFHRGRHEEVYAKLPTRPQIHCYHRRATVGEDEEVRCEFRPQRDLIWWTARFSEGDKFHTAWIHFTRAEAEASLHDLERALADLERYGDIGEI